MTDDRNGFRIRFDNELGWKGLDIQYKNGLLCRFHFNFALLAERFHTKKRKWFSFVDDVQSER